MTDKRAKAIIQELMEAVAQGHDLNLISEAKQGDKGYVTERLFRALVAVGPQLVRFTNPSKACSFRGVQCGPGTVAKAVVKNGEPEPAVDGAEDDSEDN